MNNTRRHNNPKVNAIIATLNLRNFAFYSIVGTISQA